MLKEKEKAFLDGLINLFDIDFWYIVKTHCNNKDYSILRLHYRDAMGEDIMISPAFKTKELFVNMKPTIYYTLEDLENDDKEYDA